MPKAKTPRTSKPKAEKKILQMPENGSSNEFQFSPADLETEIRMRAYEIYQQRGYTNGRSDQDWLEAEREVLARRGAETQTA
jgi:hypothetical protein